MASEMIGGAFLSASLNVLFERLASPKILNLVIRKELSKSLLQMLETTLYAVHAVLNDAEQKQVKDPAVKKWLEDLKDAVYDADDIFDELFTKAAIQKEVSNSFSYLNFQDREIESKIGDITVRLEHIAKHRDILGLKIVEGVKLPKRSQSTSLLDLYDVYGRDKDKEAIINLLLSEDTSGNNIAVIPIVGMGGIGKTTLAQLIYNDDIVKQNFDLRVWVCVSEEFDVSRITKIVLQNIAGGTSEKEDLNLLQIDLMRNLEGKKFLVILDDVWNESYTNWDHLMTPFRKGREGSKIIITTRSERVASTVQTIPFYSLSHLSDEACWLAFSNHASCFKDSYLNLYLEKHQEDIIRKCKGLPIAAKILGGLLRSKPDVRSWNSILENDIWNLSEPENKIVPALRISYHYLPSYLKRCFVHCSLFPKNHEFDRNELVLLWMGEDLLQPMHKSMTLEEVGSDYFDDLISRSFFQRSRSDHMEEGFVMHDLIHDMATYFAGQFYSRSEFGEIRNINNKTRHKSYNMGNTIQMEISDLKALCRAKSLRTFLPLVRACHTRVSIENASHILQLLANCKCLRTLSLRNIGLEIIPLDSIGELIHLRYLDLSSTGISSLPGSLCKLHNLQTLKLCNCYNLTKLPNDIQDLVNLRHLDISGCHLQEMPRGMSKLKNLHYLSNFVLDKNQGTRIWELGQLSNLGNRLSIENLQYVSNGEEASQARMMDKKFIQSLCLRWETDDMDDSQTELDILDKLQPHQNLKTLLITGYRGTKLPDWFGHSSYQNMTELYLKSCEYCCSLPALGQLPSLKTLEVAGFDALESIGVEFYESGHSSLVTPFPSLGSLRFYNMSGWEKWCLFEREAFPVLRHLALSDCPRLAGDFPKQIPALDRLTICKCPQLAYCFGNSCDHLLPKLHDLFIYKCPKIELYGEGVMSPNLTKLGIDDSLLAMGWHLPTVTDLRIMGENSSVQLFPEQSLLFPSLTSLSLENFQCLEILDCNGFVNLTSLQTLSIWGCPKLKKISGQRLPPSLTKLKFCACPMLEEELRTNADMWPKISHVHSIFFVRLR